MAQVYAQQAEAAVPDSEKKELTADERRQQDDDSDVSDEEPGDDLPCKFQGRGRDFIHLGKDNWILKPFKCLQFMHRWDSSVTVGFLRVL